MPRVADRLATQLCSSCVNYDQNDVVMATIVSIIIIVIIIIIIIIIIIV